MALEIIWSPKALQKLHTIIQYLDKTWENEVAKAFVMRTEELIQTIADQPKIFREISENMA